MDPLKKRVNETQLSKTKTRRRDICSKKTITMTETQTSYKEKASMYKCHHPLYLTNRLKWTSQSSLPTHTNVEIDSEQRAEHCDSCTTSSNGHHEENKDTRSIDADVKNKESRGKRK